MPTPCLADAINPFSFRHGARAALAAALLLSALAGARPAAAEEPTSGLFFRTAQPDIVLAAPMVASDVEIAVAGTVARVHVRQSFVNPSDGWMEGVYVFPLPEDSAVDRLVMQVGERRIVGEIKERAQAEALYRQAAEAGRHASIVSGERPNIFTTSVANIGPGEGIVVDIEYQDTVRTADGVYSLRFPMVVAPRYIPGEAGPATVAERLQLGDGWSPDPTRVPDASRITPPVRPPEAGTANPVTLAVDLDAGFPVDQVVSLYHPVVVAPGEDGRRRIRLASGSVPADRDFVLEWTPQPGSAPRTAAFAEERGGDTYLLLAVMPPPMASTGARLPRDVVFVIDTSGSMGGDSIIQAKRALGLALDRLAAGDRFNVIRFSDETSALFTEPRPWNADTLRRAHGFVDALEADGGTEMQPALRLALAGDTPAGRLRQVVFLTDGAVGNEAELFDDLHARLGRTRLFTIAIGSAPNGWFMRKAAEIGRGTFTAIGDIGEVGERMNALLAKLGEPVLTDIAVTWPAPFAGDVEILPDPAPDLYRGEPVVLAARLPGRRLADTVTLAGRLADAPWRDEVDLAAARPAAGIAALWARARLAAIEDGMWQGGDPEAVKRQATALALEYGLVSRYTSLVAIDPIPARPADAGLAHRPVAANLPQGWQYDKVFGGDASGAVSPMPSPAPKGGFELREVSLPAAMQSAMALPRTATPAPLHIALGIAALGLALLFLLAPPGRSTHAGL